MLHLPFIIIIQFVKKAMHLKEKRVTLPKEKKVSHFYLIKNKIFILLSRKIKLFGFDQKSTKITFYSILFLSFVKYLQSDLDNHL